MSTRLSWSPDVIAAFLHYGYVPSAHLPLADEMPWSRYKVEYDTAIMSKGERLDAGIEALRESFGTIEDRLHVVPLSGGLDSRAILAELCRRTVPENIHTITVGVPGSLDYRIAPIVAASAGVSHEAIDLNQVELGSDGLRRAVVGNRTPTWVFDCFFHRIARERWGDEVLFWSGYLGSRLTTNKHYKVPEASWVEACEVFYRENRWSPRDLAPEWFDWRATLPNKPLHPDSDLTAYQQLDLTIRQEGLIRTAACPAGFEHRTPFRHKSWVDYTLCLSKEDRDGAQAWRAMLPHAYPSLFSLPTTTRYGMSLVPSPGERLWWQISRVARRLGPSKRARIRTLNYIDFAEALRERTDMKILTRASLRALSDREAVPWLDLEGLAKAHARGDEDKSAELTLLISLAIHLETADAT